MKYDIGDKVKDEDGNIGYVVIVWNDGDIAYVDQLVSHPSPVVVKRYERLTLKCDQCGRIETMPFDIGDKCICGGVFKEFTEVKVKSNLKRLMI